MSFFRNQTKLRIARNLALKSSPLYVQYYITARCNFRCKQCNIIYAQGDCPEMNIHQIRKAAENLAAIGVSIVLLIGGEPFVRKDLPEIIKAFNDHDIHVRMQTNGYASKKKLQACVEAGGCDISISLDSLTPDTQDTINGIPNSWLRAIKTVANVNEVFPDYGKGFFGTVIMENNLDDIMPVIKFATHIGWWVSLVPCHASQPDAPLGFRTLENHDVCILPEERHGHLDEVVSKLKDCRKQGLNLYDCDEYLDDICRFMKGNPIRWRRRNNGVCDSPNLYFAIEPNGNLQPCCDHKLDTAYPVYSPDFPDQFKSGEIRQSVIPYTTDCSGCMYGSYPEISLTARYLTPLLHRAKLFTADDTKLKRFSQEEMIELAGRIASTHSASKRGGPRRENGSDA